MTVPAQPARVLVIEDNGLIAFAVGAALKQEGWTVVGPVGWLEQAVETSAKAEFDCAIIDAFLHGFHTDDVVANLVGRGKPFILTTGYSRDLLPPLNHAPILIKPFRTSSLIRAVKELLLASEP